MKKQSKKKRKEQARRGSLIKDRSETKVAFKKLVQLDRRFYEENTRIYLQKHKMDWDNLQDNKCPQCECQLIKEEKLFICKHPEYTGYLKPFRTSPKKLKKIQQEYETNTRRQ